MSPETVTEVEQIFGFIIAFLQSLGIWNFFIAALVVTIILGLTMRLLDALGSRG